MTDATIHPPFGTHALPAWLEKLRRWSLQRPASGVNRRLASLVRRVCLAGREDPVDVEVFSRARARLFPRSNRCEKAVFAGAQFWDRRERQALAAAIADFGEARPFVFLDIGANVGLYTLFAAAEAARAQREIRILAVEPDAMNRGRLCLNIALSEAEGIEVVASAIGGEAGSASLVQPRRNRGEVRLQHGEAAGQKVAVLTLPQLMSEHGIERVDAMKIDIEGEDEAALSTLFAEVAPQRWPRLLIAEAGRDNTASIIANVERHGYRLVERAGINAIFTMSEPGAKAQAQGGA
ncbi:FkbM family methyltransferase [Afifella pfennigii]|uniref:FkbM family methyltransferase n=1 Tax=Afifella pfennigii TaxID=209897 RepID=UPI00068F23C5|nr:FkbM family methyltransferase [Afifella pfennigii]